MNAKLHFSKPILGRSSFLTCGVESSCSGSTTIDDCRLEVELDLTGAGASSLKSLDDVHALLVCNLAEDNVLAIEPGGDDGSDEELRAVAAMCQWRLSSKLLMTYVLGPALAMERRPGLVCCLLKFSSANFSP